jgi:hypothetical protein
MTDDEGLWHLLIHTPGPNSDPAVIGGFLRVEIVAWRVVESVFD